MASNPGIARIRQAIPDWFALRCVLPRFCRKRPSSLVLGGEAMLLHPVTRFLGMSAFGPLPQRPPDFVVHPVERIRCHTVPVVVGPATNDRVQHPYQQCLAGRLVCLNQPPDFLQERLRVLL